MSVFVSRFPSTGTGVRLAVKDVIDMAGVPTTASCRAVAQEAGPAAADAACLAGARAAGVSVVGRTACHELAFGVTGVNPWFGTPVNPLDPARVPGGSSSGSAVAVATGEADVAYGTDTGGSIRIPSACCGTSGLKTTWGRIPLDGVLPLAPTMDTVGPMAVDVGGLVRGMQLLEPGFEPGGPPRVVGRVRVPCDPVIDAAVDRALRCTGWQVVEVDVPEWPTLGRAAAQLLAAEAWDAHGALAERRPEGFGPDVLSRLHLGRDVDPRTRAEAADAGRRWRAALADRWASVDVLAMPTLTVFPPLLAEGAHLLSPESRCTLPANLAGVPALAQPVPTGGPLPASLQLMGPEGSEEMLVAAGLVVEEALAASAG